MSMEIFHYLLEENGLFPNNPKLPLLIYRKAFNPASTSTEVIEKTLKNNNWQNLWCNSIYGFHHYHSNTHEVLVVYSGNATIEFGGLNGHLLEISEGDMIIIPAGVAHRKKHASENFKCIGGYPEDVEYNMNFGKSDEHPRVDEEIKHTPLPATDPFFGKNGALYEFWGNKL